MSAEHNNSRPFALLLSLHLCATLLTTGTLVHLMTKATTGTLGGLSNRNSKSVHRSSGKVSVAVVQFKLKLACVNKF